MRERWIVDTEWDGRREMIPIDTDRVPALGWVKREAARRRLLMEGAEAPSHEDWHRDVSVAARLFRCGLEERRLWRDSLEVVCTNHGAHMSLGDSCNIYDFPTRDSQIAALRELWRLGIPLGEAHPNTFSICVR